MKTAALILAAGLCAAGCSSNQGNSSSQVSSDQNPNGNMVQPSDENQNNSAINASNRQYPNNQNFVQGQSSSDLQTTSDIRKRLANQNLAAGAPNVNIYTNNGHVILTGSVASEQDKASVGRAADEAAGADNVDNELQVTKSY